PALARKTRSAGMTAQQPGASAGNLTHYGSQARFYRRGRGFVRTVTASRAPRRAAAVPWCAPQPQPRTHRRVASAGGMVGSVPLRGYTCVPRGPIEPGSTMAGNPRGATPRQLRVFVSSTSEDLKAYRAAARLAILDVDWMPAMMEHFGAIAQPTVKACRDAIANSDLVLLIVAHRKGWAPRQDQDATGKDSITAVELQHAKLLMKPILVLLAADSWPGNRWEDDAEARAYVKTFRSNLNQPAAFFDAEQEAGPDHERLPIFRSKVRDALNAH